MRRDARLGATGLVMTFEVYLDQRTAGELAADPDQLLLRS